MQDVGFTESIISSFFKPFLGGIFFDRDLNTTSRLFEFVMKMLATGSNCLPEKGIGAVSQQLYGKLPSNSVHLNAKVTKVDLTQEEEEEDSCISVYTLDGAQFRGAHVVLATEGPVASELLGDDILPKWDRPGRGGSDPDCVGTVCLYFRYVCMCARPHRCILLQTQVSWIELTCFFLFPSYVERMTAHRKSPSYI